MPSPKSGSADDPVAPVDPDESHEADQANPGEVEKVKAEQRQAKEGKYGSESLDPLKPPQTQEEKEAKKSWIEIELVNQKNKPVGGEPYRVILPDGKTAAEGTLDEKGFARIEGIEPGNCKILFPRLDKNTWKRK